MLTEASQHEHGEDDAEDDGNSVAARDALGVASLRALPGGVARVRPMAVTPAQYIPAQLKHTLLQTGICNASAPFNADKGTATCMRY